MRAQLSFLVAQKRQATDWWFGSAVALGGQGGQKLEYHHIHPQATLRGHPAKYAKAEINDLANLAFISGKATRKIAESVLVFGEDDLEVVPGGRQG